MKNHILFPLFLIFSYLLILNSNGCKKHECEYEGFEYEDGVCKCPPGKYQSYLVCRDLQAGEYYGVTTDCTCKDSTFFLPKANVYYSSLNDSFFIVEQQFGLNNLRKLEFKLIRMDNGDSLAGRFSFSPSPCPVQGKFSKCKMNGKFSKDKSTLKMYLYSESLVLVNGQFPRDTCVYSCHR
jgi:hypothetical protein